MRPAFLERLHGLGDADPVGAHQETQIFVGEGKLDAETPRALDAVFPGHLGQHLVKAVFQVGEGEAALPVLSAN